MGGRYVFLATPMRGEKCQSGRGSGIRSSVQDRRRTSLQVVGVQDVKKETSYRCQGQEPVLENDA